MYMFQNLEMMRIYGLSLLLLARTGAGRSSFLPIQDLNADCYGKSGDINLALLSGFSDRGIEQLCDLEPVPWLSLFFQFYEGFIFAIEAINNRTDILPNITLGYVVMDTCWRDLAAMGQAMKLLRPSCHDELKSDGKRDNIYNSTDFGKQHLITEQNNPDIIGNTEGPTTLENTTARKTDSRGEMGGHLNNKQTTGGYFTCLGSEGPDMEVVGLVGPGSSAESMMLAGLASVLKLPILATLATNDALTDKSRFEYFTRMVSPDKFQVEAILKFIGHFNWTYVSLAYSEGVYGENAAKMILKGAREYNICLAVTEMISSEMNQDEVEELAHKLSRHNKAMVIIAFIQQSQLTLILRELENRGIENHFIWVLGDALADAHLGNAADGAFVVNYRVHSVPEFDEYYLNLTPNDQPENPWMKYLWQMFFDCSWEKNKKEGELEGKKNGAEPLNGRAVIGGSNDSCAQYMNTPNVDQYTSTSVSLYIDSVYVYAHALHTLITENCPSAFSTQTLLSTCISGPLLLRHLRQTTFEGYSGEVSFDKNGDRLGKYHIKQYQANSKTTYRTVSELDKTLDTFVVFEAELEWHMFHRRDEVAHSGEEGNVNLAPRSVCSEPCGKREYAVRGELLCCWECRSCRRNEKLLINGSYQHCIECPAFTWPDELDGTVCESIEPNFLQWHSVATLILGFFACLLLVATLVVSIWMIRKRRIKLLKASSLQLSCVILLGIVLAVTTSAMMLAVPVDTICMVSTVGFHLSVAFIFVPLLMKTARIHRIFKSSLKGINKPSLTSNRTVNTFTAILLLIQIVLTLVCSSTFPTLAKVDMPVVTIKFVELFCDIPLLGLLPSLIFNLAIILACAALGFLTRHLPENFNESWYIFVAVATTVFTWLIFLPTYFTSKSAMYRIVLLVSSLLINGVITLVCLFLPKIYAVYFYDEKLLRYVQGNASVAATLPSGSITNHPSMLTPSQSKETVVNVLNAVQNSFDNCTSDGGILGEGSFSGSMVAGKHNPNLLGPHMVVREATITSILPEAN